MNKFFNKKGYVPSTIMLSGNTDCYQPIERKLKITRSLLEVFLKYKHPVSIISKNNLILRDLDILKELTALNLVHVAVTLNSLNDSRWGKRMSGDGKIAESIHRLFHISVKKFLNGKSMRTLNSGHFSPQNGKQLNLF